MTQSQQAAAAARAAPSRAAAAPAAAAARASAAAAAPAARAAAEDAAGGAASGGAAREHSGDGGAAGGAAGGVAAVRDGEAWQNMDARQRKLFELRLKLNESRKANQSAVVAEKRRKDAPEGGGGGGAPVSRKRAAEGSAASLQERLAAHGLDASKAYLLDSMDAASARYAKKGGRIDPAEARYEAGADAREAAQEKRASTLVHNPAEYAAAAAADPEFYRDANSLAYGTAPVVPAENVDRMVADLVARTAKRAAFSRRRKHYEDADMDSINDRNAHFNRKLDRVYGDYTAEIKANLERGTAL
jgi:pre-mRNA-splicing factor SYF2